jgi:hypothetical protein
MLEKLNMKNIKFVTYTYTNEKEKKVIKLAGYILLTTSFKNASKVILTTLNTLASFMDFTFID